MLTSDGEFSVYEAMQSADEAAAGAVIDTIYIGEHSNGNADNL